MSRTSPTRRVHCLVSNDVDVAGLEDDLVRTGHYVGQRELALLLDDWARVDGAPGMTFSRDGLTVELRGNPIMAARVLRSLRSPSSVRAPRSVTVAAFLRNELPISLVLDQELARTGGGMLLTATSPLAMAAAAVPGHGRRGFASLRQAETATEDVVPGVYVAVSSDSRVRGARRRRNLGSAVTEKGETPAKDQRTPFWQRSRKEASRCAYAIDRATRQTGRTCTEPTSFPPCTRTGEEG